jgi:membrane dipeptidase
VRVGALAALLVAWAGLACAQQDALGLHHDAIVVDTHSDTTPWFQDPTWRFDERHEQGHMDLPRMREGGLDVQFWSIYMGETPGRGDAIRAALERIDAVHEIAALHSDEVGLAGSVSDVRRIVREDKIAFLMGVEGGHIIEESLAALRTFYRLGVRYLTLTHSFHTSWADSSGTQESREPLHHGLSAFGEEVVAEMNRLGMMVDVSHVSDETFWDVLRVSRAPVIASHSSVRAIADHRRNLSDEMLEALAAHGGVVMINFYSGYIDPEQQEPLSELYRRLGPRLAQLREQLADDPVALRRALRELLVGQEIPRSRLEVLLDHFDHALRVAGADHVGIGADWDGVLSLPEGMEDVSHLPALTRGLLARGHPPDVVRRVLGENLLRVMGEVEAVARTLTRDSGPRGGNQSLRARRVHTFGFFAPPPDRTLPLRGPIVRIFLAGPG